jgi:hypothetical protein
MAERLRCNKAGCPSQDAAGVKTDARGCIEIDDDLQM